jgi:DNA-binding NarL/FixJ family response regulator
MVDSTILTITADTPLVGVLRAQLRDQSPRGSRMVVSETIDEACSLLATTRPRLIVVHWSHASHYEELNRLLWATTVLAHGVPVVVVADRYRTDQATTLYRMGVIEYISRTHHLDHFGRILDAYLNPSLAAEPLAASADDSAQPVRAWSASGNRISTARVV